MNRTIGDIMERDAYTCRYDQDLGEVVTRIAMWWDLSATATS